MQLQRREEKGWEKVPTGRKPARAKRCGAVPRDGERRRTTREMLSLADIIYLTTWRSYYKFLSKLMYDHNLVSQALCLGLFNVWGLLFSSHAKLHYLR